MYLTSSNYAVGNVFRASCFLLIFTIVLSNLEVNCAVIFQECCGALSQHQLQAARGREPYSPHLIPACWRVGTDTPTAGSFPLYTLPILSAWSSHLECLFAHKEQRRDLNSMSLPDKLEIINWKGASGQQEIFHWKGFKSKKVINFSVEEDHIFLFWGSSWLQLNGLRHNVGIGLFSHHHLSQAASFLSSFWFGIGGVF